MNRNSAAFVPPCSSSAVPVQAIIGATLACCICIVLLFVLWVQRKFDSDFVLHCVYVYISSPQSGVHGPPGVLEGVPGGPQINLNLEQIICTMS